MKLWNLEYQTLPFACRDIKAPCLYGAALVWTKYQRPLVCFNDHGTLSNNGFDVTFTIPGTNYREEELLIAYKYIVFIIRVSGISKRQIINSPLHQCITKKCSSIRSAPSPPVSFVQSAPFCAPKYSTYIPYICTHVLHCSRYGILNLFCSDSLSNGKVICAFLSIPFGQCNAMGQP